MCGFVKWVNWNSPKSGGKPETRKMQNEGMSITIMYGLWFSVHILLAR